MAGSTLGERLQQARQQLGWSLEDVSEKLNVSKEVLAGFEANKFSVTLPEIYVRGFFTAYVKLLRLNASAFLAEYETLTGASQKTGFPSLGYLQFEAEEEEVRDTEVLPETPKNPPKHFRGRLRAVFRNKRSARRIAVVGAVLLLLLGFRSCKKTSSVDEENAILPVVNEVEIIPALATESSTVVTHVASPMPSLNVKIPTKPSVPETVTLVASESVQVFVRTERDKKRVFFGTLEAGTRKSIPKESALQVSFSEGGNLTVERSDGTSVRPKTSGRGWIRVP